MQELSILLLLVAVLGAIAAYVLRYARRPGRDGAAKEDRGRAKAEAPRELQPDAPRVPEKDRPGQLGVQSARAEEESGQREAEPPEDEQEPERLTGEAHPAAVEAQPKGIQGGRCMEQQPLKVEAEQRGSSEEERRSVKRKTPFKREEAHDKPKAQRKRLEPSKRRGGRFPASTKDQQKQASEETKPRPPKPEIVCWQRERQWILAIEVPDEYLAGAGLTVRQDGLPLDQDESRKDCWHLEQARGQVVIRSNKDEVDARAKITLEYDNGLLFKLSGQNQNRGRLVRMPSSGSYLMIVPDDWERDHASCGPPRVAPEPVSLPGYQAHFFNLEKDGDKTIAFRTGENKSVRRDPKMRFELVGSQLNDASESMGPLFGEKPPKIRACENQAWTAIETIIVGEEGTGPRRWRMAFGPIPEETEQDLPSEIAKRKSGWYFLRFYDANDDLVDSLDFRLACPLRHVGIRQLSPFPPEGGHSPVCVEFLHDPDCAVRPADMLACGIEIERRTDRTILLIPPDVGYDETRWLVSSKGRAQVEVVVLVERIWWTVGEENNAPLSWKDSLLTLAHADFRATSRKALWLRIPRRRWADRVLVGFELSKARAYPVKVTKKTVAIALRDFSDSQEVEDRAGTHCLEMWIKHDENMLDGTVATIPPEQLRKKRQKSSESHVPERRAEKKSLLNPAVVSTLRLAAALTKVRRATHGQLRVLIKEVRQEHLRGRAARRVSSVRRVQSIQKGLCGIAFALEMIGQECQIPGLKKSWRIRASWARDQFPEIMSELRACYKNICTNHARHAGNTKDKRPAE